MRSGEETGLPLAINRSRPWKRTAGETNEGIQVRFTQKDSTVYAMLLRQPKTPTITLKSLSLKTGSQIYLLGHGEQLVWSRSEASQCWLCYLPAYDCEGLGSNCLHGRPTFSRS